MWFRTLLTLLLIYLLVRYVSKLFRPSDEARQVRGNSPSAAGRIDQSRIKDATFEDLPDK